MINNSSYVLKSLITAVKVLNYLLPPENSNNWYRSNLQLGVKPMSAALDVTYMFDKTTK